MKNIFKKWPKFLTIKRTVFLLVVLITALSVTIYFVGGYKGISPTYLNQEFSTEGFTSYTDALALKVTEATNEANNTVSRINTLTRVLSDWENIDELTTINRVQNAAISRIDKLIADETDEIHKKALEDIKKELSAAIPYKDENDYAVVLLDDFFEVLKNDHYVFYFNQRYASFKVVKLDNKGNETDEIWYSNPALQDIQGKFLPTITNKLLSQLVLTYVTSTGVEKEYTSYEYAVTDKTSKNESVIPYFSFKNLEVTNESGQKTDAFQVYYHLEPLRGAINYTYFPKRISVERWNELIERNKEIAGDDESLLLTDSEKLLKDYELVPEPSTVDNVDLPPHWKIGIYEGMTGTIRQRLYNIFYVKCGYSIEEAEYDNNLMGVEVDFQTAEFKVAIQYTLNEFGLEAKILSNSVEEFVNREGKVNNRIVKIDLLPYFGTVEKEFYYEELDSLDNLVTKAITYTGQIYIPDGAGAAIDLNSNKTGYVQFSKRVYTTDLVYSSEIKETAREDVMLPMGGIICDPIVHPTTGLVLEKGKNLLIYSNIGESQMMLNARIAENNLFHNQLYFSICYRDSGPVTIGAGYYQKTYTKYSEFRVETDAAVTYHFLEEEENTSGDLARAYRNHLIDYYGLTEKDETDEVVLNVDIIGAYDYKDTFLGIQYTNYDTMTTFSQAVEIVEALGQAQARNVNLYIMGWRNQGLRDLSFEKFKISKEMGGKKGFTQMLTDLENTNMDVDVYPYLSFGLLNEYQESFGKNRYSSRNIGNDYVEIYPYYLAANVYDNTKAASYILSPRFYQRFMSNLLTAYQKQLPVNNVAFDNIGGVIASDFRRHDELFRYTAKAEQIKVLQQAQEQFDNITLYAPYVYAIQFADNILELPYDATLYEVVEDNIPLYQLVVNGLVDYSGMVVNANDAKGTTWHLMKILGTGSNVSFTFSYDDSNELSLTDYNYYTYTQYSNGWMKLVEEMVAILNASNIYRCYFVNYEKVATNVYKASYQAKSSYNNNESYQTALSKNQVVEIYLNYGDTQYIFGNNEVVPSKNYYIARNFT